MLHALLDILLHIPEITGGPVYMEIVALKTLAFILLFIRSPEEI